MKMYSCAKYKKYSMLTSFTYSFKSTDEHASTTVTGEHASTTVTDEHASTTVTDEHASTTVLIFLKRFQTVY